MIDKICCYQPVYSLYQETICFIPLCCYISLYSKLILFLSLFIFINVIPGTGRTSAYTQKQVTPANNYTASQKFPNSDVQENSLQQISTKRDHLSSEGSDDFHKVQKENDSLVIQVVNDFTGSGLDGRGQRRGEISRGGFRGSRGEYRGAYNRGGGADRPGYRGRGARNEYRRDADGEYRPNRGNYHRGEYRGRGDRGSLRSRGYGIQQEYRGSRGRDYEEEEAMGYSYRGGRGATRGKNPQRGGRRGGRGGHRYEEHEPPILGTVVIDTTPSTQQQFKELKGGESSVKKEYRESPGRQSKDTPLSPESDASGSWATDSQGEWETDEEGGDEDQYEEDEYWEEGLEYQDPTNLASDYQAESHGNQQQTGDDVGTVQTIGDQGKEAQDSDVHNSSSESLERFIQEHTLHLNIKTGNLETANIDNAQSSNNSLSTSDTAAPFSPLKTPEGHVHVLDWAAEVSSPERVDLSLSFTSASEQNESLDAADVTQSPGKVEKELVEIKYTVTETEDSSVRDNNEYSQTASVANNTQLTDSPSVEAQSPPEKSKYQN